MGKIINNIIFKILVKSGYKKMGNYVLIGGRYRHIDVIKFEFITGSFLILFVLGFCVMMYKILWVIC